MWYVTSSALSLTCFWCLETTATSKLTCNRKERKLCQSKRLQAATTTSMPQFQHQRLLPLPCCWRWNDADSRTNIAVVSWNIDSHLEFRLLSHNLPINFQILLCHYLHLVFGILNWKWPDLDVCHQLQHNQQLCQTSILCGELQRLLSCGVLQA